jgi:hypothetical protein
MLGKCKSKGDRLLVTLDLLDLKTLAAGAARRHSIAYSVEQGSSEIRRVEEGTLYPALCGLDGRGWFPAWNPGS